MTFSFEYFDNFLGFTYSETVSASDWGKWWDYECSGEITILHVEATTDNWETSFEVYHQEG